MIFSATKEEKSEDKRKKGVRIPCQYLEHVSQTRSQDHKQIVEKENKEGKENLFVYKT